MKERREMVMLAAFIALLQFVFWCGIAVGGFWLVKHAIDTFGGK